MISSQSDPVSVLFVCLGNICRSPLAEGIFAHLAAARGLADRVRVDSAGTGSWHVGNPADPRAIAVAAAHGVRLTGAARQVTRRDFHDFEVIVAMDRSNRRALEGLRGGGGRAGAAGAGRAEIVMMRWYGGRGGVVGGAGGGGGGVGGERDVGGELDVPDPYYGGVDGFEEVYRILERCCEGLLGEVVG